MSQPDTTDRMIYVLGLLSRKAFDAPPDVDGLSWRVGYANALSDLVTELWPEAAGGRRMTCAEIKAADELRRDRGGGSPGGPW